MIQAILLKIEKNYPDAFHLFQNYVTNYIKSDISDVSEDILNTFFEEDLHFFSDKLRKPEHLCKIHVDILENYQGKVIQYKPIIDSEIDPVSAPRDQFSFYQDRTHALEILYEVAFEILNRSLN